MVCPAVIEIHKEELSFSAGHFTIFSATERENLHGHNYNVSIALEVKITHNGLAFDYRDYKKKMLALCEKLDRNFLLPDRSPYLQLEETEDYWLAHFNSEKIPFLKKDVLILPLSNITIEELAQWFLQEILKKPDELTQDAISGIRIRVYNGPGQSASASWTPE